MKLINFTPAFLMKKEHFIQLLLVLILCSCESNESKKTPGLAIKEEGLSCDNIFLADRSGKINTNTFVYGDKVSVNFNNIKGFQKENGSVFPGLRLLVLNKKKDTMLFNPDLNIDNTEGYDISPLLLYSWITMANPMLPDEDYKAYIHVWDKKGTGTLDASLNFNVIPDPKIHIDNKGLSYNELYLYSEKKDAAIISDTIPLNEEVYWVLKGLKGFDTIDEKVLIGVSMKIEDVNGNVVLNEADLIGDTPIDASQLEMSLTPHFIITKGDPDVPIDCSVRIWDKRSDREISVHVRLNIENEK